MGFIKDSAVPVFRFDDVSENSHILKVNKMVSLIRSNYPTSLIVVGASPLTHSGCDERVFPSILNAQSDHRVFYSVDSALVVEVKNNAVSASHGLVHVDHRLLNRQAQELSILTSCSLTKSKIFIPPFNKWNADTESICQEHGIELIKWEDGWLSAEFNKFDPSHKLWYLHSYAWTVESFKEWLCC